MPESSSSIKFLQTEVYPTSENRCVAGAGGKLWEQWKCFPPLELQPQNRCHVGTKGKTVFIGRKAINVLRKLGIINGAC